MGREVTDAELLNDEPDDVVSQETQDSLDELKDEEADEIVEAKDGKDGKDEFDIVIREDDDDPDAGTDDANIDAKGDDGVGEHVDDDAGTDVTDDFLTPDEKKNYSKAMQKRITRERRAKEDAEGRAITEATARRAAESRALKADKINVSLMLAMVTRDIETTTAALKQAKEDGDTDAEVKALGELGDLQAKKREAESRDEDNYEIMPQDFTPGGSLTAPPPRPGMVQRWIRIGIGGKDDGTNSSRKFREGWSPRAADSVGDFPVPKVDSGRPGGVIQVEQMILCERSERMNRAHREFIDKRTQQRTDALQADLQQVNRDNANKAFGPIRMSSSRSVISERGGRAVAVAEDE